MAIEPSLDLLKARAYRLKQAFGGLRWRDPGEEPQSSQARLSAGWKGPRAATFVKQCSRATVTNATRSLRFPCINEYHS